MNQIARTMILASFTVTALAQEPAACHSGFSVKDVIAAMAGDIRAQPVFGQKGLRGWRLYSTTTSEQLTSQGIANGALMTHICGIPASEISANKDLDVCCAVDVSLQFEVKFQLDDQVRPVVIKR